MGFLDNTSITVDAILTKLGRERLSQGQFSVTHFSLSDEEIDYKLYDVSHPNGTDSYGAVIENMNLLEAQPNKDAFMSHLVNESIAGATLNVGTETMTLDGNQPITIKPKTIGGPVEQYTFLIGNRNYVKFNELGFQKSLTASTAELTTQTFGTPDQGSTTITVTGVESALSKNINITVNKTTGASGDGEGSDGPGSDTTPPKGGEIG